MSFYSRLKKTSLKIQQANPLSQSKSLSHFEELRAKQREEHLQFHQKLIQELEKSQGGKSTRNQLVLSAKSADEQVNPILRSLGQLFPY